MSSRIRRQQQPRRELDTSRRRGLSLDARAAQQLIVEVPLVKDDGQTVLRNPSAADLDSDFSYRDARPDEAADASGVATKYRDKETGRGSVNGDGRAVAIAEALERDATERVVRLEQVGFKGGVDTGLFPTGLVPGQDGHTGGGHPLYAAVKDALSAGYLEANGVNAERWVAVQNLGNWLGRFVRAGDFVRLAHLNAPRGDPDALPAVLDQVNKQLCRRAAPHAPSDRRAGARARAQTARAPRPTRVARPPVAESLRALTPGQAASSSLNARARSSLGS